MDLLSIFDFCIVFSSFIFFFFSSLSLVFFLPHLQHVTLSRRTGLFGAQRKTDLPFGPSTVLPHSSGGFTSSSSRWEERISSVRKSRGDRTYGQYSPPLPVSFSFFSFFLLEAPRICWGGREGGLVYGGGEGSQLLYSAIDFWVFPTLIYYIRYGLWTFCMNAWSICFPPLPFVRHLLGCLSRVGWWGEGTESVAGETKGSEAERGAESMALVALSLWVLISLTWANLLQVSANRHTVYWNSSNIQ